jgi:hypothetical protein
MLTRTPGLPLPVLLQRLERTAMSGRDIRALLHDPDFQAIPRSEFADAISPKMRRGTMLRLRQRQSAC